MKKTNKIILNDVSKAKLTPYGFLKYKNNPRYWVKDCGYFLIWVWIRSSSYAEKYCFEYGIQFLNSNNSQVTMYLSESCSSLKAEDYLNKEKEFEYALSQTLDKMLLDEYFIKLCQGMVDYRVLYNILLEDEKTKDYTIGWMWRYWNLTSFCYLFNMENQGSYWLDVTKQETENDKYFEDSKGNLIKRDFVLEFEHDILMPFIESNNKQKFLFELIANSRKALRVDGLKNLSYDLVFENSLKKENN